MSKLKVYISGKISGLEEKEAELNFAKAEKLLKEKGFDTINPKVICAHLDGKGTPWEDYMAVCLSHMPYCQAIYMQKNWGSSTGGRVEYAVAQSMGMRIMFEETN